MSPQSSDGGASAATSRLRLDGVRVDYGSLRAVDDVDLEVGGPGRRTVALLGPSGCGKSTLLRAVAGIERLSSGAVLFDDSDLAGIPVHRRGFGLVFQDGQLFPHRTVAANIAYGLRGAYGRPIMNRRRRAQRVAELLELVGLPGYEDRPVGRLSGGQAQRVALARALAPRPRLLLLDEPLSSLDRELRDRLAADIGEILRGTGTPALLVTHDHGEAAALADRIAVMDAGRIVQEETAARLWQHPADASTARFLGYRVFLDGIAEGGIVRTPVGSAPAAHPDGPVRVGLRAESVRVDPAGDGVSGGAGPDRIDDRAGPGWAEGTVRAVRILPPRIFATVAVRDREAGADAAPFEVVGTWAGGDGEVASSGAAGHPRPGDTVRLRLVPGAFAIVVEESTREVAAGAVLRGGRVLLAQRSYPAELAGKWELPGGKVEPGETAWQGLERELREELGITVRVRYRLGGEVPLHCAAPVDGQGVGGDGAEATRDDGEGRAGPRRGTRPAAGRILRAYAVEIAHGSPRAREHSAIRWAGAHELDGLDLVEADRLWVPELKRRLSADASRHTAPSGDGSAER